MEDYDDLYNLLLIYNSESHEEKKKYVIITGGIGDFLALDYIYKFSRINNIIFISSQSLKLKQLLKDIPLYQNKYFAINFNFKKINKPGFDCSSELIHYIPLISNFSNIKIINISDYFPKIRNNINILKNNPQNWGSKIMNIKLINNIKERFNLPNNIVFISPITEDNRINCIKCNNTHTLFNSKGCILTRNFIENDYIATSNFLKQNNLIGVIVSSMNINIPQYMDQNIFINLSTKTTLLECIEILKISKYYIGIDGLFSIIASKIINKKNIFIKSNNKHLYNNKDIYYFPHKNLNISSFIKF